MNKKIIFTSLILSLIGCGSDPKKDEAQKTTILPLVQTAIVQKKSFTHKISIQGNIESTQDIMLNSELSGMIKEVTISSGQMVKQGEVLVIMDAAILTANIDELNSQLEFAQYMLEKQVELFNQNLGSEFDKRSAENQVTSIESKLKTLAIQKSKMTVIAPFDGKVDQVFAKKGQLASPQMPLMRLVNTENTEVVASVSEKHFKNIKKGTEIKVNFPNYNIEPVITKASTIGSYIDPTNRTFTVRAKIANNAGLMPNMLTELEITDFKIDSGLVVPSASILKNAKSQDYIWVLAQDKKDTYKAQQVFIDKIMAYQGQALIEGHDQISEGSIIIEGGARGIAKKDIVRIK
jgi:RND family efflux transporter MFP subunit